MSRSDYRRQDKGSDSPLLSVKNLTIEVRAGTGTLRAVDNVSLDIGPRECVAIVGETGAGKSMTGRAVMNLLPPAVSTLKGSIGYRGEELLGAGERKWRQIRGNEIGMVFQDPMGYLNPTMRVGKQIQEAVDLSERWQESEGSSVDDLLRMVGLQPEIGIARRYPFELSGGMRQRILLAIALAGRPSLLVADEPTTALDVTIQAQILETLRGFQESLDMAVILITHDLGIVAEICDRVYVMYAGEVVETGTTDQIFHSPKHPYTQGLLSSILTVDRRADDLQTIPGTVPDMRHPPAGCRFMPRCPHAHEACEAPPPLFENAAHQRARCWLYDPHDAQQLADQEPWDVVEV